MPNGFDPPGPWNEPLLDRLLLRSLQELGRAPAPPERLPDGARLLDVWRDGASGAVLFLVDESLALYGDTDPVLHCVSAVRRNAEWVPVSTAGCSLSVDDVAPDPDRAVRVIGGCGNEHMVVSYGFADDRAFALRLEGAVEGERSLGPGGFFLEGARASATHIVALDEEGVPLAGGVHI